ncbi:MAG: hypothetical protein WEC15_06280 [Flavobacteriales bacterium]
MSTREQHPIDDHFRRSLAAAEVEPPAHVWAGVQAVQGGSGRRRGFLLWPLLLLLGVGAAGTYHFFGSAEGQAETAKATNVPGNTDAQEQQPALATSGLVTEAINEQASATGSEGVDTDGRPEASNHYARDFDPTSATPDLAASSSPSATNKASLKGGTARGSAALVLGTKASKAPAPEASSLRTGSASDQHTMMPSSRKEAAPNTTAAPALASVPEAGMVWAEGQSTRPRWMPLLPPPDLFVEPAPALRSVSALAAPYVLPPSEWWVGPSVGIIGSRLRWRGDDAELAEAINKVSGTRNDLAFGIAFGRTWRSGWGFSSGIYWQQGQQRRTLVDQRTVVEQELIPRVVSLNAVVVFSTTDTLTTTTTTETALGGVERSTVLRIPLHAHWHGTRGRLLYGAHLGLALEHTTYRGGPTLVRDASDGRIAPVQSVSDQSKERFPLALLGTVGLDVGLQLHERWALRGGPVLMHGLAPLQRTSPVFALPDRWGLQFQLVHHLYRRSPR